jgi:hypothetical protein
MPSSFGVPQYKRNWKFSRWTTGLSNSDNLKNVYSVSFGYTSTKKKVSAASTTAILGSTATSLSSQTITAGISNPDVPRALQVVVGGTAGSVLDCEIVVTGQNSEGKVITESFMFAANATATVLGTKAFSTVTSVFIPAQAGTAATVTVGTQNKLGVFHRLYRNNTTVKVYTQTTVSTGTVTLQAAPTVVANETVLELNLVTPATAPDASFYVNICYAYDNWMPTGHGYTNDGAFGSGDIAYYTSTSTSTSSTSTSTTTTPATTTSTSSISTSSTSSSTSSTSSSTSSTSTSTTTAP